MPRPPAFVAFASLLWLAPAAGAEEPPAAAAAARAAPAEPATAPPPASAAPAPAPAPAAGAPTLQLAYPPLFHPWPIPVERKELPVNWWLPPVEIVAFTAGLHLFNRTFNSDPVYDVTWEDIQRHFQEPWVYDKDQFLTNQFAHPYEGSVYFNTARSLGHGFWVSSAAAFVGSWTWEMFAEAEQPSINDQITTTVAGSFLGEILHRMANVVLDGGGARPSGWREFAALAISPANGVNRWFYGDRYRPTGSTSPPSYGAFRVAYGLSESVSATNVDPTASSKGIAIGGSITYGLAPGDWEFRAPFDYFDVAADLVLNKQANTRSASGNFSIHGLLLGSAYGSGTARGLWGLFGTYDYLTPQAYRASSSALGLGTTGQLPLGRDLVLIGSGILSLGFGAGGTLTEDLVSGNRDYHFGAQAVAYLAGKLVFRDRLALEAGARQYFTSGKVSPEPDTWEESTFATAELTWRIAGPHGVGVHWTGARRNAYYPDVPAISSRSNEVSVFYTLVSDRGLGVGRVVE